MMAVERHKDIRLGHLVAGILALPQGQDRPVTGLSLDSREVTPGGLFLACRGLRGHGLEYAGEAVRRGCAAILWEPGDGVVAPETLGIPCLPVPGLSRLASGIAGRFHGEPSRRMRVIGVTGTNGKTSVTHLIAGALALTDHRATVAGTLGYGLPGALRNSGYTTADAVRTQALLAEMADDGVSSVAMEVSSHALSQARVEAVYFEGAVFTNLSHEHLDYHGSLDAYLQAKARLFARESLDWAVLNADDPAVPRLAAVLPAEVRRLDYGTGNLEAAVRYCVRPRADGLRVELEGRFGRQEIESEWLGEFNGANLAAAFTALCAMDSDPAEAAAACIMIREKAAGTILSS
jgi:UDP-N-acetylmuramoyl-L-alanyl-D-glutamate--2,6-diaminopimelate ligase